MMLQITLFEPEIPEHLTFFKINIKGKVVLAKIPGHFLVGDRRPPNVYARLKARLKFMYIFMSTDMVKTYLNTGNNKITELRTILQRESQNSYLYKQTKSVKFSQTFY
jgi:hypothetical protein